MSDQSLAFEPASDPDNLFETALEQGSEATEYQEGDVQPEPDAAEVLDAERTMDDLADYETPSAQDIAAETGNEEAAENIAEREELLADEAADEVVGDNLDIDSADEEAAAEAALQDEADEGDANGEAGTVAADDSIAVDTTADAAVDTTAEGAVDTPVEGDEAEADVDPYEAFKRELRMKPGKWYVVHTYAGFERRVKQNLAQRTESMEMADFIYQCEVPMEDVVEIKNGQRKMVTRVRVPGYVLVRMMLTEDSWSVVRHTPGVTGFVGNAHNPTPLRFNEAFDMLKSLVDVSEAPAAKRGAAASGGAEQRQPVAEVDFEIGETITIKEGSFAGLTGTINEISPASGKLTVLVSLFERETPVELSFDQVTKL